MTYLSKPFLAVVLIFILTVSSHKADVKPTNQSQTTKDITEEQIKAQQENAALKITQARIQKAIQVYFDDLIDQGLIMGAGVSIVKGQTIMLSSGYGQKKVNKASTVDGETVFRLGSISKGFTGVLMGKLKYEGLLDWNDTVGNYLFDFMFNTKAHTDKITISHLLSHTTGAPYHSYTDLVEAGMSLKKIAAKFARVTPISAPGEQYSYQNAMFALSGEISECVTGNTINTDLETNFFKPLDMYGSSTDLESLLKTDNIAYPHRKQRKAWRAIKLTDKYYNAVPAGGVNASALDMAKWMRFLINGNELVMPPSALAEVFNPVIKLGGKSKYYQRWQGHIASYYGYGWRIHEMMDADTAMGNTIIHHGGSVNDFRNEIALFPEEGLGICVLFNSMTPVAKHVIPDLHAIISDIYKNKATAS